MLCPARIGNMNKPTQRCVSIDTLRGADMFLLLLLYLKRIFLRV